MTPDMRISIVIYIFLAFISGVDLYSLGDSIPKSQSNHFPWAWKLQIAIGVVGFIYNGICLSVMLSLDKSSRMSFYTLNLSINTIDLFFSIERAFYGIFYMKSGVITGGHVGCFLESFFSFMLVMWSGIIIAGMSWVARYDMCNGVKIRERDMLLYVFCGLIYSTCATFLILLLPYGGYGVQPSASFCFVSVSSKVGSPIIFIGGWLIPSIFLTYNSVIILKTVQRAQALLVKHDIKEQAKAHYVHMVTKMTYFLVATIICFTPVAVAGVYEGVTQSYIPGWFALFSGTSAILNGCIINPTLFFYLNNDLRLSLKKYVIRLLSRLKWIRMLKTKRNFLRVKNVEVHPHTSNSSKKVSETIVPKSIETFDAQYQKLIVHSELDCDYEDVNYWLSDPTLFEAIADHGRKEFSLENFLFYKDVRDYYFKGLGLLDLVIAYQCDRVEDDRDIPGNILSTWSELEALGVRLYMLYIWVPNAPLEINISSVVRKKITFSLTTYDRTLLDAKSSLKSRRLPKFEDILKFPSLDESLKEGKDVAQIVWNYVHLFDECVEVVNHLIMTGIWPRFRKTIEYKISKSRHLKR